VDERAGVQPYLINKARYPANGGFHPAREKLPPAYAGRRRIFATIHYFIYRC
jgi:hypothetical protein